VRAIAKSLVAGVCGWMLVGGGWAGAAGSASGEAKAGARTAAREFVGFDRNEYPGDAALPVLRRHFAFVGYWLNRPPGETGNGWSGKREKLARAEFGFLALWNGRTYAEILSARRAGTKPEAMGAKEGAAAVAAARAEHFPPGTLIFLDQEEGGRMLPEQGAYLLAWTEAVARGGDRPGVYGSGQPVADGPGRTITTAEDIRARVKAGGLHAVSMWVYQDGCPPSNGCSLSPPALSRSGTAGAEVWQYAQSPRRPEITRACAKSYAKDGNCEVPELPGVQMDLDVAGSADPSRGR